MSKFELEILNMEKLIQSHTIEYTGYKLAKNFSNEVLFDVIYSILKHHVVNDVTSYKNDFEIYFKYELYRKLYNEEKLLVFFFKRNSGIHYIIKTYQELEEPSDTNYIFAKNNFKSLYYSINDLARMNKEFYLFYYNKYYFHQENPLNKNNFSIFKFGHENKPGFDSLKIFTLFKQYCQLYNL